MAFQTSGKNPPARGSGRQFFTAAIFLLSLPTLPLILCVAAVLTAVRAILTFFKNRYRPDYGEFLSGANNLFSGENPYEKVKHPVATIVLCVSLEGDVTMEEAYDLFKNKFDLFWNRPDPWFPELKQYLTTWMGFAVWKNEPDFNVSDHLMPLSSFDLVGVSKDFKVTEDTLTDISYRLSSTPFVQGKSPWQILLHKNRRANNNEGESEVKGEVNGDKQEEDVTWVFLRFHHTLCDGLSVLKLVSHLCDIPGGFEQYVEKFSKSLVPVPRSTLSTVMHVVTFALLGLYEVVQHMVKIQDINAWHKAGPCQTMRRNFRYTRLDPMSTAKIKRIREVQGQVRFVPILLAALTGGLRKYMIKHGVPVPEVIHTVSTVPIPKSANRLNNNLIFANLPMPTGLNDRTEIVQVLEKESALMRTSRIPVMMMALIAFLGLFPRRWIQQTVRWTYTTSFMSNVPGPDEPLNVQGYPTNVHGFMSAIPESSNGIYYWIVGCGGDIKINLGVSDDIVPTMEDLQEIRQYVQEEFDLLQNPANKLIIPDTNILDNLDSHSNQLENRCKSD